MMRYHQRSRARAFAVLLLVLTMVAAACGDSSSDTTAPEATTPAATDAPTTDAPTTDAPTTDAPTTEAPTTEAPSGEPIVVGGSLALTGFLGPTAAIHKLTGEMFVENLNASGGLLGRPVEWIVLDDESAPDKAASNYERLITEDEVDLIMGPYGTGTIAAAVPVAERYGYVIPHHSGSLTYTYGYDCSFPAWGSGRYPNETVVSAILDMLEASGSPPETVGFVVNQFPGSNFLAYGTTDGDATDALGGVQTAKDRGYDVVLDLPFPTGTSDWGPIAAQVRDADPDFLWVGALGLDAVNLIDAMEALDYRPQGEYYLWPAPGPLVAMGEATEGIFLAAVFADGAPERDTSEAQAIIAEFKERAEAAGMYSDFETQAAGSWSAWQILTTAVEATGSLENDVLCDWLVNNPVDTMAMGTIDFDPAQNNYYGDQSIVAQLRDGVWLSVWPEADAGDNSIVYPTRP